jgi:hypothetical protein
MKHEHDNVTGTLRALSYGLATQAYKPFIDQWLLCVPPYSTYQNFAFFPQRALFRMILIINSHFSLKLH